MSVKRPAWGVYDIFETAGGGRLFVGIVTDTQWQIFCREFGEAALASDERLGSNAQRVKERGWLIPRLGEIFKASSQDDLSRKLEAIGLPYAPIAKPWDLLDDPHLKASGGLFETKVPLGKTIHVPGLPIALDGQRLPKRKDPPALGEGARELLADLGYRSEEIDALARERAIILG
jgi:crotonobetainyl-CoA:carnitine CoA-transferase CaiB-like acyl-CoA transferase